MHFMLIVVFCILNSCRSLLIAQKQDILEHSLAECVVTISLKYFDTNLPVVVHTPSTFYAPRHKNYKYGDKLIQTLQSQGHLSIIVVGNRSNRNSIWQTKVLKPGSVIIMIPPIYKTKDLEYVFYTYVMIQDYAYNPSAKVLIVISDENKIIVDDLPFPQCLLNLSFKFGYLDVIVLEPNSVVSGNINFSRVRILGWTINEQSNICSGKLDKIKHIETWVTQERKFLFNSKLYPEQGKLNLRRCILKIMINPTFPYSNPWMNASLGIVGPIALIHYLVAKSINVRYQSDYEKYDIEFPSIYDPVIRKHWYRFTYPYFGHDIVWYVPPGREIPRWQGLVRAFSPLLWSFILLTSAFGTLTMWLLQKSERHSTAPSHRGILAALSSALLTLLGVAVTERYKGFVAVLFFMLWLYYCLIINTVYQSELFGRLVYPGHFPPIQTLKEIEESGLIMERTYFYNLGPGSFWAEQMKYKYCEGKINECVKKVAGNHTHALTGNVWLGKMHSVQFRDTKGNSKLVPLKELVGTLMICLSISMDFVFLVPVFNKIISRIINFGLLNHCTNLVIRQWNLAFRDKVVEIKSVMTFSVYQLQGQFYLLMIGLVLASFVFAFEFFVYFIRLRFYVSRIRFSLDRMYLG
ncbi:Ionotropic receptor 282 [Blattella germanica]|nr:Ionotropic receptor 282 [Blattella germanica]